MSGQTAHPKARPRLAPALLVAQVLAALLVGLGGAAPGAGATPAPATVGDPALMYSSFLGGELGEIAYAIALDRDNNVYIAGQTESRSDFPVLRPRLSFEQPTDLFVAKLRADGTLVYSTRFGGEEGHDAAHGIAVDEEGNVYVTGYTTAADFPVTPDAHQRSFGGGAADAFVVRLDRLGQRTYSSFLGGSGDDRAFDLARTAEGDLYIVGATTAGLSAGSNPQPALAGDADAFLARLDPALRPGLIAYYGGQGADIARSVALDGRGLAYLAGATSSPDLPLSATAPQRAYGRGGRDAFVAGLDARSGALVFSTYLGGAGAEGEHIDLAIDAAGDLYLTGATTSPNFPTRNALQRALHGATTSDAFISRLRPSSGELIFSTFFGGERDDFGAGVAIDPTGAIMVTGGTASAFFPLTRPFQERGAGSSDAFVARLSGDGAELLYSSLLGGRGEPPPELPGEYGAAVAADGEGKAYLVGSATSADFPLTSPLADGIYAGFSEAFIAAITPRGQSRDRISSWSLVCRPEAVEIFGAGMYQRDRQQLAVEGGDWVTLQLGGKLASPERELPESVAFTFGDGRVVTRERPHRLLAEGYAFEWSGAPGEVGAAVAERPGQTTARALVAYAPRPQAQGLWTSVGRTTMLNVYRDRFAPAGLSLRLPEPLARATDVSVAVAFFDNDPDERPLVVRAEAGGVAAEAAQARSTHGEMLNIERLTLRAVPAGTQELRVTLASPVQGGDSGLLLGASASYPCEGPPPGDGQAPVVEAFTINDGAPIVEGPEVRLSVRASAPTPGGSVVALRIAELVCRPGGGGGGCVWSAEQERTVAYPATPAAIAWALAPLPGARTFLIWAGDDTGAWSREPASAAVEVVLPRDQGAGRDGAERRLVFLPVVQRSGVR